MNFFGKRDRDKKKMPLTSTPNSNLISKCPRRITPPAAPTLNPPPKRAHRELGNIPLIQQTARDQRPIAAFFDNLLQDIRFALRTLRKNPSFTIIAVLTLTLGIGANTAIFSVVNAVILHPLPFKNADRLVDLAGRSTVYDFQHMYLSIPDINDVRSTSKTLTNISVYSFSSKEVVVDGKPDRVDGSDIDENRFPAFRPPAAPRPHLHVRRHAPRQSCRHLECQNLARSFRLRSEYRRQNDAARRRTARHRRRHARTSEDGLRHRRRIVDAAPSNSRPALTTQ